MSKKPKAKIVKKERLFEAFLSIDKLTIKAETHDGRTEQYARYIMERGDAVGILAYDPKTDQIILGNEMRPGVLVNGDADPYTDNVLAGGLKKGEDPVECAKRETMEESGLVLENCEIIHPGAYVSSGGTSERIILVFGTVDMSKAGGVHGNDDENESIKSVIMKRDEFMKRLDEGSITDMKTLAAGLWLERNIGRIKAQYGAGDACCAPSQACNADRKLG